MVDVVRLKSSSINKVVSIIEMVLYTNINHLISDVMRHLIGYLTFPDSILVRLNKDARAVTN